MARARTPSRPAALEISYRKKLRIIIEAAHQVVRSMLYPELERIHAEARAARGDARQDSTYSQKVDLIFQAMRASLAGQFSDERIKQMAKEQAAKVSDFSRRNVTRILANAIGVDIFLAEPYLQAELDQFVQSNVDLITTVKDNYLSQIKQTVMRGIQTGTRVEDLKDEIEARYQPAQNHAELIARDQVTKFNGQLNQLRQREVGVEKYIWSTSKDERVRGNPSGKYPDADPSHWEREGKIFSWDDPPEDGHPGEPIQCRCIAIPVINLEQLAGEEE